jgi:uncharacterized protein YbcC (UPF0753/DUF2309 family)
MGKEMESLQNPSGLAYVNQNFDMAQTLEDEYERITLRGMNTFDRPEAGSSAEPRERPSLQFYTCFDEREESFRRYIEAQATGPNDIETYGVAGFFNVAIRYKTADYFPEEILAPEGNCPPLDHRVELKQLSYGYNEKKKLQAEISLAFEKATYSPVGSVAISGALLPYSMGRLLLRSFAPMTTMDLEDKFRGNAIGTSKTDFAPPFDAATAMPKLSQLFKNIGTNGNGRGDFARLVLLLGHGARRLS